MNKLPSEHMEDRYPDRPAAARLARILEDEYWRRDDGFSRVMGSLTQLRRLLDWVREAEPRGAGERASQALLDELAAAFTRLDAARQGESRSS